MYRYGKINGLSRFSIFSELYSIDFVRSFALDAMHLYWENIVPTMFDLWRGKFFSSKRNDEREGNQNNNMARKTKPPAKKFWDNEDIYNVKAADWQEIAEDMKESSKLIPSQFGSPLRNIANNFTNFKANEWQNWALFTAPVLLKGILDDRCYTHFMRLVSAFTTSMDTAFSAKDIITVKEDICAFLIHYEATYYQYKYDKVSVCTSQFHYLAHIPDMLEWLGPVWAYWQFPMERMCGIIVAGVGSRIQANRNISCNILHQEQLHALRYLASDKTCVLPLGHALNQPNEIDTDDDLDNSQSQATSKPASLSGAFLHRISKRGPRVNDLPEEDQDIPNSSTLVGRSQVSLQTHERRLIRDWYSIRTDEVDMSKVPVKFEAWKKLRLSNGQVVRSLYFTPSNDSGTLRDSSVVRYELPSGDGNKLSHYGHLLLLISTGIPLRSMKYNDSYDIALIQRFHFESDEDGNLLRIKGRVPGPRLFISTSAIKELVGQIRKDGINYIVDQYTAFMV